MKNITELPEWIALSTHQKAIAHERMQDWFSKDPTRFDRFSLKYKEIFLDYSKNRVTHETLSLLNQLAIKLKLKDNIENLFSGKNINHSENRPALHTALRNPAMPSLTVHGQNIMKDIRSTLDKMQIFSQKIRNKTWRGASGKPIRDIINIGIGGSHLGPLMTTHALKDFATKDLACYFISNIDSAHIHDVLAQIDPERALFIISSKSFTTLETITHASTLRTWLQNKLGTHDLSSHFIAITSSVGDAVRFGIPEDQIFPLWDWVGGRYSIWSAIGLPLAILIGMDRFLEFLAGANDMDQHFRQADFLENIPVLLGLLGIWYINFFNTTHHAIVPYSHHLNHLRAYLQQLDMESNGKQVSHEGNSLNTSTCPVIFGEQGSNGQHSFHQLLHQGNHLIPVDFILIAKENAPHPLHHTILIGSCLSQAEALMRGKSYLELYAELMAEGIPEEKCDFLAKHKAIPGNRPSNILFLHRMTPYNLGALIALYEHKTFVQGVLWQINSFDQWGVELGKKLLAPILANLNSDEVMAKSHDSSTQGLIQYFKNSRGAW